jgi:hypothetical protein
MEQEMLPLLRVLNFAPARILPDHFKFYRRQKYFEGITPIQSIGTL